MSTWAPVVLWMGVIFVLSSRDGLDTGSGRLRFDVAKLAHLTVYFVLGMLLDRALDGRGLRRQAWWVMVLLVMYALTDEIHQSFVPGRTPLLFDIGVDSIGGLAGIAAWRRYVSPWLARRAARASASAADPPISGSPAAGSDTQTARP
ncbi:MAG TPA: VanZ family protein [Candidatus Limnocylindrales bacterium]